MTDDTLLVITGAAIAPYSARGLTQTLEPIEAAANLRRTINGTLRDISASQMRKYKSTVTGKDNNAPAFGGVWPGKVVTVDCVAELCFLTAGGAPERPAVPGSVRTDGDFTFYRPRLVMRVVAFSSSLEEWRADCSWSLQLEEV